MSHVDLDNLLSCTQDIAKTMMEMIGEVRLIVVGVLPSGQHVAIPMGALTTPQVKASYSLLATQFRKEGMVAYIVIGEVWKLCLPQDTKEFPDDISENPERTEELMIYIEDANGEARSGAFPISRSGGKPSLGEWQKYTGGSLHNNFAGWLKQPTMN